MRRFIRLITNEFVKVFSRKTIYVMLVLIPVIVGLLGLIVMNSNRMTKYGQRMIASTPEQNLQSMIDGDANTISSGTSDKGEDVSPGTIDFNYYQKQYTYLQKLKDQNIPLGGWQAAAYLMIPETVYDTQKYGLDAADSKEFEEGVNKAVGSGTWQDYVLLLKDRVNEILTKNPHDSAIQAELDILTLRIKYTVEPNCTQFTAGDPLLTRFTQATSNSTQSKDPMIYKNAMLDKIKEQTISLKDDVKQDGKAFSDEERAEATKSVAFLTYRIEHNMPEPSTSSMTGFLAEYSSMVWIVSLFVIIIAATLMASEYGSGTIKLLLISPYKRWKLFFAKLTSIFLIALIMLGVLFISSLIMGGILYGFKGTGPLLLYNDGDISAIPYIGVAFIRYLLVCPELIVMTCLSVMFAVIMRHSAVAIGVGIAGFLGGSLISQILRLVPYDFKRFILFLNTDLSRFSPDATTSSGSSIISQYGMPSGMTLSFSLCVLAVYAICFTYIALDSFNRRDIK